MCKHVGIVRSKIMGQNREQEFLDGRVSMGSPCGRELIGLDKDAVTTVLKEHFPKYKKTSISMVYLFLTMPVGTIILTPSLADKEKVHIFKTISKCKYEAEADTKNSGNPHYVEVDHLATLERSDLPAPVLKSVSGTKKQFSKISRYAKTMATFLNNNFQECNSEDSISEEFKDMRNHAISTVEKLLNSTDELIRLKAAKAILDATA